MTDIDPRSPDPEQAVGLLLRDLKATPDGLSAAEADRRLLQYGTNELRRRHAVRWPAELAAQLTHPLALLLWVAAALSLAVGNLAVAIAVLLVIFLNALFALIQESAGWHPGDRTGARHPLHHAYLQATTMTFVGMIMGQIGTAFAVRTRHESLRSIGVFSNRYLLLGIAGELALAVLFVYAPPLQALLGTAALPARDLLFLLPYPLVVWGADELRRWMLRRREGSRTPVPPDPPLISPEPQT